MQLVGLFLFRFLGRVERYALALPLLFVLGCSSVDPSEDESERAASQRASLTAIHRVNSGGGSVGGFVADQFYSGGLTWTSPNAVSTTGVADAAPASVYQSERYGDHTYTFGSVGAGAPLTVRLHFAETKYTTAGARRFNVFINDVQVLTNFDVFAVAGANHALVRDFAATSTADGKVVVRFVSVTDNARVSALEIFSNVGGGNQAPAVAANASANVSSSGTSATLSALGSDDGGEASLTYTWSATGTPPAPVTFTPNATNAAKNSSARFSAVGAYTLMVTIRDSAGASVTSSVNVTVAQQPASIAITPSSAQVPASGTQGFAASVRDQFGSALATQPNVVWSASGGGSIDSRGLFTAGNTSGAFSILASSGSLTGSASVTVSNAPGTPVYRINCGGGAVGGFSADQFMSGGTTWTESNANVSTSGVTNAAPATLYNSERYGNHSYTFPNLSPGGSYTVRLHFAETKYSTAGARKFNVSINGAQVLTSFDIYANAGFSNALVLDFGATASSSGQIKVDYVTVTDNAKSSGIEVLSVAAGGGNQAPTIATAAAASPNPATGTTVSLSALGADDGGEANLVYTWAAVGSPPAPVTLSANASNAAKNTTATFSRAGTYVMSVTATDAAGATATSQVSVVVQQQLTTISVSPTSASVAVNRTQQFLAAARDQFGTAMSTQPSVTWSVSGGGTIDAMGVFTAGNSAGGPFSIAATSGSTRGTASVSVTSSAVTSYATNFDQNQSPISEAGAWSSNLDPLQTPVSVSNGLAIGTQTGAEFSSNNFNDSAAYLAGTFPPNQRGSAVIHKAPGLSGGYQEVEILLRWSVGALRTGLPYGETHSYGYEINLAWDGQYSGVARFKEEAICWAGNITSLGVQDGDIFSAEIVGNTITSKLTRNGVSNVLCTVTDNAPFPSGTPGIGFYRGTNGSSVTNPSLFAFTSFSATSL